MTNMFHLGLFTSFAVPDGWFGPWGGNDATDWTDGSFFVDVVRAAERARFDAVVLEDASMVSSAYGGNFDIELRHAAESPRLDPVLLAAMLAQSTQHIGIVPTISTSRYKPFQAARVLNTLDHVSHGRAGWNIVTSSEDGAAQNYGMAKLPEHDERYAWADEFVDVCEQLWDSWQPDAVVADVATRTFAAGSKVSAIDHHGSFFDVKGPFNAMRSPQGRPVYCQAGSSPRGREFAATHADMLLTQAPGLEAMKAFRDDIRMRAERAGRNPDDVKVFFVATPIVAESMSAALERRNWLYEPSDWLAENSLAHMAAVMEIDFSKYDLDTPIPDLQTNGHQGGLDDFRKIAKGSATLREAAHKWSIASVPFCGTAEMVADQMQEAMDYVGGDGFLIASMHQMTRNFMTTITDGLAPELQRRGLTRTSYEDDFRASLKKF